MTKKLMERNWLQQRSAPGSSSGQEHYQSSFQFSSENNLIIRSRPLSFCFTFLIFLKPRVLISFSRPPTIALPCLVYLSLLESLTKYFHDVPLTGKDNNLIKYLMLSLILAIMFMFILMFKLYAFTDGCISNTNNMVKFSCEPNWCQGCKWCKRRHQRVIFTIIWIYELFFS